MIGIRELQMRFEEIYSFSCQPEDIFVILSGDQLYRMDFSKMVEEHLERGADVTVAAKPVPISEASGLGLLRIGADAKIVDFVEKPTDPEVIARLVPPELKAGGSEGDRCGIHGNLCF